MMTLANQKWNCNPILIAVDLLNRSSRFKSQQITQEAQGDLCVYMYMYGGRGGLFKVGDTCVTKWTLGEMAM